MLTIEALNEFGADTKEGLARCMGNEDFYFRLIKRSASDEGFEKLYAAVAEGDLRAGFEAAHSLKGVMANLALTRILGPVNEITELLRASTDTDYTDLIGRIKAAQNDLIRLCEE